MLVVGDSRLVRADCASCGKLDDKAQILGYAGVHMSAVRLTAVRAHLLQCVHTLLRVGIISVHAGNQASNG